MRDYRRKRLKEEHDARMARLDAAEAYNPDPQRGSDAARRRTDGRSVMSAWLDRILRELPADLAHFWIACDPDNLLLDECILHGLRERGFEVLPFEDSIVFRSEYEERYRAAWDHGERGSARSLVLQLRGTDLNALPWDYVRDGRKVSLGLADLFPKLSYGVIQHIDSEYHETLFQAHNRHATQPLGEGATKDFILTHIFRISPYLLNRTEDFWHEVLRLHYRGSGLPSILADHVGGILVEDPDLKDLPVAELPLVEELRSPCLARLMGPVPCPARCPQQAIRQTPIRIAPTLSPSRSTIPTFGPSSTTCFWRARSSRSASRDPRWAFPRGRESD